MMLARYSVTGALSGSFGDARICRATRARVDAAVFVGEHAGEPIRDVRSTVITFWHRLSTGVCAGTYTFVALANTSHA